MKAIIFNAVLLSLAIFFGCDKSNDNPTPKDTPLFQDSFETGDMSATNNAGFSWDNNNATSVVNGNGVVWENGSKDIPVPRGSNWTAKDQEHSLRFFYKAGEYWSEQRFDLGSAYPEIWFRYWLRVPTNFKHGSGDGATNQKLFALWMDGYSSKGAGATVVWNPWNDDNDGSYLTLVYGKDKKVTGSHEHPQPWISYPKDQGRWMQIVLHAKASSSSNSNDGLIETYRRWEDEKEYTQIHKWEDINLPLPASGPQGWSAGYIMGWVNAPYEHDTEWLLDDFTVSTKNLLIQ